MTDFTYELTSDQEGAGLPDEIKRCIIDGGTLAVTGAVWTCDQSPAHQYNVYKRSPDLAYVFVGISSGIQNFRVAVVEEVEDVVEVVVMSAGRNRSINEVENVPEVVVMAIV